MRTHLRLALAAAAALALLVPGASAQEKTGTITGMVTFQGKPLTGGFVTFVTEKGKADAKINADGTYRVRGVPVGPAKIVVASKAVAIPARYANADTSGLIYRIKEGRQVLDIELK
jgi:hypothetical protein